MQSTEVMKKLADNYETRVFVSRRYPSSMSRLKNLLMSEGVSETSATAISLAPTWQRAFVNPSPPLVNLCRPLPLASPPNFSDNHNI